MRRNFGLHLFLLLILTLCLLAGAASAADDKKPGELYGDLDGLFSWYYATGSLPEGASLRENSSHLSALYAKNGAAPDGADAAGLERITYCCLEFVSGDKALNDAVLLSVERKGTINPATMADERYLSVDVRINNAVLVTPGSAVFRLTLESASFRFVKDYTLRVFSPEDVPAITYVAPAPRFHCRPGDTLDISTLTPSILSEDFKNYCVSNSLPCPYYGASVSGSPDSGLAVDPLLNTVSVRDYGLYPLEMKYYVSNLEWTLPFEVEALSYSVTGPSFLLPGASARYRILDEDAGASRRFTWSVSGNEAAVDPQTGLLEVSESAVPGRPLTLTITPDADPPLDITVVIPAGVIGEMPQLQTEEEKGFRIPVPVSTTWEGVIFSKRDNGWVARCRTLGFENTLVYVDSRVTQIPSGFREEAGAARAFYDQTTFSSSVTNLKQLDLEIDGHPARMVTYTLSADGQASHFGEIHYVRNNCCLSFRIYASRTDVPADRLVPVSFADLERFAAEIHYDEEAAPLRESDTLLSLTAKGDKTLLAGGESLVLAAAFANPNAVKAAGGSGISWALTDPATGEAPEFAVLSAPGVVMVYRTLQAPAELDVVASSDAFGTSASLRLTVVPAASALSLDPQEGTLYLTSSPVAFRALPVPETIPADLMSWTFAGTCAELTLPGDGSAVISPLGAGSGMLTVAAPGGRRTSLKITVLIPVESVELTRKGDAVPGAKISYTAAVLPKNAANRKVSWSVDVSPDIASISSAGKLTISKEAPVGTQITVTCTAPGAPEPVIVSETLTVSDY